MLKLAAAVVDVTPPDGQVIGMVLPERPAPALDPLYARLFLLDDGKRRFLAVSLDYCGTTGAEHRKWVSELAMAAGTTVEMTMLHSVHQHDAPFINVPVSTRLYPGCDFSWLDDVLGKLKAAAAALEGRLAPVARLGWSETRMHGYASNRRVPMPDGRIATRYSRCGEPEIRNRPVGDIDPILRTLGFYGQDGALMASWSFYATHPQVGNLGLMYGGDAPGEAMRILRERLPGAVHSPFNGCFGNITAGKYSDPYDTEGNIRKFGRKVADTIIRNLASQELFDAPDSLEWDRAVFPFPEREYKENHEYDSMPIVREAMLRAHDWALENAPEMYPVSLLGLGDVRIFWLPGELFVEYQIWLQAQAPDEKLCVVGNCGDDFYYVGTAEAVSDPEGYEMRSFCRTAPEFEGLFKKTAGEMLRAKGL